MTHKEVSLSWWNEYRSRIIIIAIKKTILELTSNVSEIEMVLEYRVSEVATVCDAVFCVWEDTKA